MTMLHKVSFAPDVVLQVIDGDALLLKLQDEEVFSLNATGARIAELVAEGLFLDAIVARLAHEYEASPSDVRKDVDDLVRTLRAKGLLVVETEEAAG
jgi:Coenzyme PQQ synthesis protein D (PqqD)